METGTLASLVSVVDWWADGNGTGGSGVGRAQVVRDALGVIGAETVLVNDSDVAGWALGSLEIWAANLLVLVLAYLNIKLTVQR